MAQMQTSDRRGLICITLDTDGEEIASGLYRPCSKSGCDAWFYTLTTNKSETTVSTLSGDTPVEPDVFSSLSEALACVFENAFDFSKWDDRDEFNYKIDLAVLGQHTNDLTHATSEEFRKALFDLRGRIGLIDRALLICRGRVQGKAGTKGASRNALPEIFVSSETQDLAFDRLVLFDDTSVSGLAYGSREQEIEIVAQLIFEITLGPMADRIETWLTTLTFQLGDYARIFSVGAAYADITDDGLKRELQHTVLDATIRNVKRRIKDRAGYNDDLIDTRLAVEQFNSALASYRADGNGDDLALPHLAWLADEFSIENYDLGFLLLAQNRAREKTPMVSNILHADLIEHERVDYALAYAAQEAGVQGNQSVEARVNPERNRIGYADNCLFFGLGLTFISLLITAFFYYDGTSALADVLLFGALPTSLGISSAIYGFRLKQSEISRIRQWDDDETARQERERNETLERRNGAIDEFNAFRRQLGASAILVDKQEAVFAGLKTRLEEFGRTEDARYLRPALEVGLSTALFESLIQQHLLDPDFLVPEIWNTTEGIRPLIAMESGPIAEHLRDQIRCHTGDTVMVNWTEILTELSREPQKLSAFIKDTVTRLHARSEPWCSMPGTKSKNFLALPRDIDPQISEILETSFRELVLIEQDSNHKISMLQLSIGYPVDDVGELEIQL